MSFFTLSSGEQAKSNTSFELAGGEVELIPAGTIMQAVVTEAKWDEHQGEETIKVRWDVVGKDYKGRVIFQKIRATDSEPKKRDKAIQMLMAIDANSGSHLSKLTDKPSDDDLSKLCNKKMGIMVDVWKLKDKDTGEEKSGNWVKMVSSVQQAGERLKEMGGANPKAEPKAAPAPVKQPAKVVVDVEEDDCPF